MDKIIPINKDAYSPIVIRETLPWSEITDIHVIYQTKDGKKMSCSSCDSWGTWLEFLAMMQYEAMQHIERSKDET